MTQTNIYENNISFETDEELSDYKSLLQMTKDKLQEAKEDRKKDIKRNFVPFTVLYSIVDLVLVGYCVSEGAPLIEALTWSPVLTFFFWGYSQGIASLFHPDCYNISSYKKEIKDIEKKINKLEKSLTFTKENKTPEITLEKEVPLIDSSLEMDKNNLSIEDHTEKIKVKRLIRK